MGRQPARGSDSSVTIALDRLDRVLEIDDISRAARIQAGVLGPALEDQLRPHGYTLRHFPQSFRFSSLGGWIATRSGGHYATNHTHIDDFVESVRMLTPQGLVGVAPSARLAAPARHQTAWCSAARASSASSARPGCASRRRRPTGPRPASPSISWAAGYEAVRQIVQAKLWPANCGILDPAEAGRAAGLDGMPVAGDHGFESAELSQRHNIGRRSRSRGPAAATSTTTTSASTTAGAAPTGRGGAVGAWRDAFIGVGPGVETTLGLVADTFETAITWDRWPEFDALVRDRVDRPC